MPGASTTPSRSFLLPVACDKGGFLVSPEDAQKQEAYACPGCEMPVLLRKGTKKRPHFAHRASYACSRESVLHHLGKRLVQEAVVDPARRRCIRLSIPCPCGEHFLVRFPDDISGAAFEKQIGPYRVDVVLTRGSVDALAVEIRKTHAVDDQKAAGLPLPWVELDAEDLVENSVNWRALRHGRFRGHSLCRTCRDPELVSALQTQLASSPPVMVFCGVSGCTGYRQLQLPPMEPLTVKQEGSYVFRVSCRETPILDIRTAANCPVRGLSSIVVDRDEVLGEKFEWLVREASVDLPRGPCTLGKQCRREASRRKRAVPKAFGEPGAGTGSSSLPPPPSFELPAPPTVAEQAIVWNRRSENFRASAICCGDAGCRRSGDGGIPHVVGIGAGSSCGAQMLFFEYLTGIDFVPPGTFILPWGILASSCPTCGCLHWTDSSRPLPLESP